MDTQEAFDEAYLNLVAEVALDDVIEKLAAIGLTLEPWQREHVAAWLDRDEGAPLSVRVLRLRRSLDWPEGFLRDGGRIDLSIQDECAPDQHPFDGSVLP